MQVRAVLLCVGTLLFAACGDDENSPAAELSGEFQAGGVSGLHYVTPTRSGTTDANGTFKYLAGEPVTFSVGAIQLGQAPGASRSTPFTLVGMTPPTTSPRCGNVLEDVYETNFEGEGGWGWREITKYEYGAARSCLVRKAHLTTRRAMRHQFPAAPCGLPT